MEILVRPPELRQTAEALCSSAQKIAQAIQTIDNDLNALKGDTFMGNRASLLQSHYADKRDSLLKASKLVVQFSKDLELAAGIFERADVKENSNVSAGLPKSISMQQGAVLGITTATAKPIAPKLADAIQKEEDLKAEYNRWMVEHGKSIEGWTEEKINKAMADIEKLIDDLEKGIGDMNAPKNLGDWLLNTFTHVDEDFTRSSQENISKLKALLEIYQNRKDLLAEKNSLESVLNGQKQAIIDAATKGSISDSATPNSLRKYLGGCTNYVAGKRDISDFNGGHPGNAGQWNEQAKQAGYRTGDIPVKGAIIVYEGGYDPDGSGPKDAIGSAGHVGYVESVTRVEGSPPGYQIRISQANTIYGANYPDGWKRGAHTTPTTVTKFISEDGIKGISFIYDKP